MPDLTDTPYLMTVAQSTRQAIGKRFCLASDNSDGVFKTGEEPSHWCKPSDVGAGGDSTANQSKFLFRVVPQEHSLQHRFSLREQLSKINSLSLIMGVLSPDASDALLWDNGTYVTNKELPRLAKKSPTLIDAPRAFLTLDLDGLSLKSRGIDVVEDDAELPDIIADVFDQAGLDWLIADCVMQLSSSHGIIDKHAVRVHLDWHLDKPLTLQEQRSVARYINVKARAANISDQLVDESVYDPSRLMFTGPSHFFKRVWTEGVGIREEAVNPRVLQSLQRVRLVHRGDGRLRGIPSEALDEVRLAKVMAMTRKGSTAARKAGTGATGKDAIAKMEPGNVYTVIRRRIYAAATQTPAHLQEQAKERVKSQLHNEIISLKGETGEATLRRLRHLSDTEFERSWQGALDRRYPWEISYAFWDQYRAPVSPEAARNALRQHLAKKVQDGIEYANRDTGAEAIPPRPQHTLINVPPGVGKTRALVSGVRAPQLMTNRISYLAPTTRLSEEATGTLRSALPKDDYTQGRVRHHRGRASVCSDEEYGRLATQAEASGTSPITTVCSYCPRRDACPWPEQYADKESGFIAGQHAHLTTTLAKIRNPDSEVSPAVGIVDESIIDTLIKERVKPIKLTTLQRWARRGVLYRNDGHQSQTQTIDLVGYRTQAVDALKASDRLLTKKSVNHFFGTVRVQRGDEMREVVRVNDALDLEAKHRRQQTKALGSAFKEFHELRAANKGTHKQLRLIQKITARIRICDTFITLYRSIKASLGIEERQHIFGVRVTEKKSVSIHIRADLPAIMRNRHWIWLDGTADPEIWRALVGDADADTTELSLQVMTGPYRLTQFPDRAYSKRMFANHTDDARTSLARMHRYIQWQAMRHKDVLVVCQKEIRNGLEALGLPSNVSIEHYNNLRGLNAYKNVACAIVIGRAMPRNALLEVMTEALHYDNPDVGVIEQSYGNVSKATVSLSLGATHDTERPVAKILAESHPDKRVQAMRRQLVDAEVQQAIMRLRLFDRTEDNKAELIVFGQTDTKLVVDELCDWNDAERTQAEILIAGGILTTSEIVAHKLAGGMLAGLSDRQVRHHIAEAKKQIEWPQWSIETAHGRVRAHIDPNKYLTAEDVANAFVALDTPPTQIPKKHKPRKK
jgi:hypothetical protein